MGAPDPDRAEPDEAIDQTALHPSGGIPELLRRRPFGLLVLGIVSATGIAIGIAAFAASEAGQLPGELPYMDAEATALSGQSTEALIAQADGIAIVDVLAETGAEAPESAAGAVQGVANYVVIISVLGKWSPALVEAGFPGTPGLAMPIHQAATWLDGRRQATLESPPLAVGRQYLVFVAVNREAKVVRVLGPHVHLLLGGRLYLAGVRGLPGGAVPDQDAAVAEMAFWALPLDRALAIISHAPASPQPPAR